MKYNEELIAKVKNHEVMIKIDDWDIIGDLVNYIYTDDAWLQQSGRTISRTNGVD